MRIIDKGPRRAGVTEDGRCFLQSESFAFDARLYIDADFYSQEEKEGYAVNIANMLNFAAKESEKDKI